MCKLDFMQVRFERCLVRSMKYVFKRKIRDSGVKFDTYIDYDKEGTESVQDVMGRQEF